ncbi:MAG: arginine N-succinyltransferase [Bacteriovoracaceae bacterium]|nr:arginine N-succinyltransferase [Bacteriovoracaceae bacterium]
MFYIRSVRKKDVGDLFELSQKGFINLPPNKKIISKRVELSVNAFKKPSKNLWENYYIFVIEDVERKKIVGTSLIHSQHGTTQAPNFYLKVSEEHKFSKTLKKEMNHQILKLEADKHGVTEIGGLILHKDYRSHPEKLGKQLSFVRFLYMSLYPKKFKPEVLAELLPPLDKNGNSIFWRSIGKKFMGMSYQEADELSRYNKEFIVSLYPGHTIYTVLLPTNVRKMIGQVGPNTVPAKKLLESVGFKYKNEVDPFDGGPNFSCRLSDIIPIKNKIVGKLDLETPFDPDQAKNIMLKLETEKDFFTAVQTQAILKKDGRIILPAETIHFALDIGAKMKEHMRLNAIFV